MSTQAELVALVAATERSIADLRDALRQINEPEWQDDFARLIDQADSCRRDHSERPTPRLADDYAALAGLLRQNKFADDDKDRDRFRALRGARGMLLEDCREILECAEKLGLRPTEPETPLPSTAMLETAGREGQLIALQQRITVVETMLAEKLVPEAAADKPQSQVNIVNHYVQDMRRYTTSIRLSISIGDGIDLAVIERAATAMGRATLDMIDTVRARASKATQSLRDSMTRIGTPVKRVVSGARLLVQMVRRSEGRSALPLPAPMRIPEDFLEQAHTMILAGVAPPDHWVPYITKIEISDPHFDDPWPIKNLTAVKELSLAGTSISNISFLKKMELLQSLDLSRTDVSDISVLQYHSDIKNLRLWGTNIKDIDPLKNLSKLENLNLWGTNIDNSSVFENLMQLKSLDISQSKISDISFLDKFDMLEELSIWNIPINDIADFAYLSNLTNLRKLNIRGTRLDSTIVIQNLTKLRELDISDNNISSVYYLRNLTALSKLNIKRTKIDSIEHLSNLKELEIIVESSQRQRLLIRTLTSDSSVEVNSMSTRFE